MTKKNNQKIEKALKKAIKEDQSKVYLTKKQVKFYRRLIREKLEACGFANELLPYRTGVRKFRPKIVDRPDEFTKDENGNPVDLPAIQHTPVEMVTYRNLFENMTKKILRLPINEIEAFLALDDKEFKRPEPAKVEPEPEKKSFFKKAVDLFKGKESST